MRIGIAKWPDPPAETKAVTTCCCCGEDIYVGDEYVRIDGMTYHCECFRNIAETMLFERYGAVREVAEC